MNKLWYFWNCAGAKIVSLGGLCERWNLVKELFFFFDSYYCFELLNLVWEDKTDTDDAVILSARRMLDKICIGFVRKTFIDKCGSQF